MQQLHITDPDIGSTGIPFWAGIPTEYQPRMEFLTGIDFVDTMAHMQGRRQGQTWPCRATNPVALPGQGS